MLKSRDSTADFEVGTFMMKSKMEGKAGHRSISSAAISTKSMELKLADTKPSISLLDKINSHRTKDLFGDTVLLAMRRKKDIYLSEQSDAGSTYSAYTPVNEDTDVKQTQGRTLQKRRDSSPEPPTTPSSGGYVSPWEDDFSGEESDSEFDNKDDEVEEVHHTVNDEKPSSEVTLLFYYVDFSSICLIKQYQ